MPENLRREILQNNYSNIVVIAGAGTGKTTLLIDKIKSILQTGVPIETIAAITFTEKAATEISDRLKHSIEKSIFNNEDPNRFLKKAREEIHLATLTTLHGFAAKLLKEKSIEAGIAPDHIIESPLESKLLFYDTYKNWEANQMKELTYDWDRIFRHHIEKSIPDLAWNLYQNMDIISDLAPPRFKGIDEIISIFISSWNENISLIKEIIKFSKTDSDTAFQKANEILALDRIISKEIFINPQRVIKYLNNLSIGKAKIGKKTNWKPDSTLEDLRSSMLKIDNDLKILENSWNGNIACSVYFLLESFIANLSNEKARLGRLDFSDLLRLTRKLLKNRLDVRNEFQKKYNVLLVDEFQDTDPLQAEILFFIAEENAIAKNWEDVRLSKNKLFIVGDPKQSIYRFRRADVEIFNQVKNYIIEQGGVSYTLERNFRSKPQIIDFVNSYFEDQMNYQENNSYQSRYDHLKPVTKEREEELVSVEFLIGYRENRSIGNDEASVFQSSKEDFSSQEAREFEAESLAVKIKELLTKKYKRLDCNEPYLPQEIAILFRTTTQIDLYTRTLREYSIPYRVVGSKRYYLSPEIIDSINLIHSIVNPQDKISLIATLRSPACGINDIELTFLAQNNLLDYRYSIPLELINQENSNLIYINNVYSLLKDLHNEKDFFSFSELIRKAIQKTSIWITSFASLYGKQKLQNLMKLMSIASQYESLGVLSISELSNILLETLKASEQEEEADIQDGISSVTIMSIHRSKGLEWPVVILPSLMSKDQASPPEFIEDRQKKIFGFKVGNVKTENYDNLAEEEEKRLKSESVRLQYVAMTRAKELLVLSGAHLNRSTSNFFSSLCQFLSNTNYKKSYILNEIKLEVTSKDGANIFNSKIKITHMPLESDASTAKENYIIKSVLDNILPTYTNLPDCNNVDRFSFDWSSSINKNQTSNKASGLISNENLSQNQYIGEAKDKISSNKHKLNEIFSTSILWTLYLCKKLEPSDWPENEKELLKNIIILQNAIENLALKSPSIELAKEISLNLKTVKYQFESQFVYKDLQESFWFNIGNQSLSMISIHHLVHNLLDFSPNWLIRDRSMVWNLVSFSLYNTNSIFLGEKANYSQDYFINTEEYVFEKRIDLLRSNLDTLIKSKKQKMPNITIEKQIIYFIDTKSFTEIDLKTAPSTIKNYF